MSRMTKKTLEDAVQIVTEKVIVGTEWDDIENKEVQESTEKVEMMRERARFRPFGNVTPNNIVYKK